MTAPIIPAVPDTTPAWLTRAASAIIAVVGFALDKWDPSGKINSTDAQLGLVLAFLVVAFLVFAVTEGVREFRAHGWSVATARVVASADVAEARQLVAEGKPLVEQLKPVVDKFPLAQEVEQRLGSVEAAAARVEQLVADGLKVAPADLVKAVETVLSGRTKSDDVAPAPAPEEAPTAVVS